MSLATHCDREGCDTWARTDSSLVQFITVSEGNDILAHLCCLDCLLHWSAARSEPTTEVAL